VRHTKGDNTPVYPIREVSEYTGLSARQLRYYEQRGLVEPARSQGNQRLYSAFQVKLLQQVRSHLDQGLNLAGIRNLLEEEDFELPARTAERPSPPAAASLAGTQSRQRWLEDYPARHLLTRATPSIYPPSHQEQLLRRFKERPDQEAPDSPAG